APASAMLWLALPVALYFLRGRLAGTLAPLLQSLDPQKTAFRGHLLTLVLGLVYILPLEFVGLRAVKRPVYLSSLWCNILTLLWTLKSNYGTPPMPAVGNVVSNFRQHGQAAIQMMIQPLVPWLTKAMNGADFHWLFFVLIWMAAYPTVWVILIIGRRSLWSVGTYCTKNLPENRIWKAFAGTWGKLKEREAEEEFESAGFPLLQQVLQASTVAEIVLGFWIIVSLLFPWRQFLIVILYWNFLRQRYQAPRSHEAHLKAWRQLGVKVAPLLQAAPFLNKPIDMAKGWFAPQQQ
ncbi:unnamed protein product, partial [Symbiodinium pilosum]